jgi:hypothetical protein
MRRSKRKTATLAPAALVAALLAAVAAYIRKRRGQDGADADRSAGDDRSQDSGSAQGTERAQETEHAQAEGAGDDGHGGEETAEDAEGGKGDRSPAGPEPQDWQCECGQEYRVSGEGRHRVYWLRDASPDDPVLEPQCPNCERPLPHEPQSVG